MAVAWRRTIWAAVLAGLSLHSLPCSAQGADRWLGHDKALHFAVGAGLAAGGYGAASLVTRKRAPRVFIGLTLGIGASALKEGRDRRTGGDPSWKDFTAGVLGSITGTAISWFVDRAADGQPRPAAAGQPHPATAAR